MRRRVLAWVATITILAIAASGEASESAFVPLGEGPPAPRGLAVTANGQTVVVIDGDRKAIMAADLSRPHAWRDVVGPAGPGIPEPVVVGCLPGDVVAAVCRAGDAWTLRTFRTTPAAVVEPIAPLQEIPLGDAKASVHPPSLTVHHARGWLVIAGLPRPLPPVVRAVVAGVRLGPLSDRSCPIIPEGYRPTAVTGTPSGDVVLVLRAAEGDDMIGFYDATGCELLRLSAGIRHLAGLDFGRGDGMLWAVGSDADGRDGLWRLDAMLHGNRQAIRPVLVGSFQSPRAVASASERALIVTHGGPDGTVSRVDPTAFEKTASGKPAP